jgi:hypothetical protein
LQIKIDRVTLLDEVQRQMLSSPLFYFVLMFFSGQIVTMIGQDAAIGFVGTAATKGNVRAVSKLLLFIDMLPVSRLNRYTFRLYFYLNSGSFPVAAWSMMRLKGARIINTLTDDRYSC